MLMKVLIVVVPPPVLLGQVLRVAHDILKLPIITVALELTSIAGGLVI
jgi:hypothetical protein